MTESMSPDRKKVGLFSIHSLKKQVLIADRCFVAEHFFARLRGLIGKTAMESGEAMLFPRCNDIHMWFMSIPIDIVFLRRESRNGLTIYKVCAVHENVKPWRPLPLRNGKATDTLELCAGTIERRGVCIGDELCLS